MICDDCKCEMTSEDTKTCTYDQVYIGDQWYNRNTEYFDHGERCHDCNIKNEVGNIHHFGCSVERCPACGEQLLSCDCIKVALRGNPKAGEYRSLT